MTVPLSRRGFLKTSARAVAGASVLAGMPAPGIAQKRELTFLSWNHYVPASDDELRKQAEAFGKQAGVTVRVDTITTYWSIAWCYGAKVLEPDGKTPGINSDKTAQVIEYYKELYRDAMDPEVLSWDDASNNRGILSGKYSWIHNPISPYNAALK